MNEEADNLETIETLIIGKDNEWGADSDSDYDPTFASPVATPQQSDSDSSESEGEEVYEPETRRQRRAKESKVQSLIRDFLAEPERPKSDDEDLDAEVASRFHNIRPARRRPEDAPNLVEAALDKGGGVTAESPRRIHSGPEGISDPEMEPKEEQREIIRRLQAAGRTASGLPAWCGYFGKGRPDGYWIEGRRWQDRRKRPGKMIGSRWQCTEKYMVHLFEFTFTSEAYFPESRANKHAQHREIMETLQRRGILLVL